MGSAAGPAVPTANDSLDSDQVAAADASYPLISSVRAQWQLLVDPTKAGVGGSEFGCYAGSWPRLQAVIEHGPYGSHYGRLHPVCASYERAALL